MKLVLASQGFMTKEIVDSVVNLVQKPKDEIKISIINESYVRIKRESRQALAYKRVITN